MNSFVKVEPGAGTKAVSPTLVFARKKKKTTDVIISGFLCLPFPPWLTPCQKHWLPCPCPVCQEAPGLDGLLLLLLCLQRPVQKHQISLRSFATMQKRKPRPFQVLPVFLPSFVSSRQPLPLSGMLYYFICLLFVAYLLPSAQQLVKAEGSVFLAPTVSPNQSSACHMEGTGHLACQ